MIEILAQLTNAATSSETLVSSLRRLLQIWADARNLVRNRRPKKDNELIGFIRNELFSRTQAVRENTRKARSRYSGQLLIAERMMVTEREHHDTTQRLAATTNLSRLKAIGSVESLLRIQNLKRDSMQNVIAVSERIGQIEDFLKSGVEEDYPVFREARPLLVEYLMQCLALQEAKVLQYEAKQFNREKLIGWLDHDTTD